MTITRTVADVIHVPAKEQQKGAENMVMYGSRFAVCIGRAWKAGDKGDRDKLSSAFPDLFHRYASGEIGRKYVTQT